MEKLKEMRKAAGLSQQELAIKVNMPAPCLSRYENGKRGMTLNTAAKIAAALNCKVDDLIEERK